MEVEVFHSIIKRAVELGLLNDEAYIEKLKKTPREDREALALELLAAMNAQGAEAEGKEGDHEEDLEEGKEGDERDESMDAAGAPAPAPAAAAPAPAASLGITPLKNWFLKKYKEHSDQMDLGAIRESLLLFNICRILQKELEEVPENAEFFWGFLRNHVAFASIQEFIAYYSNIESLGKTTIEYKGKLLLRSSLTVAALKESIELENLVGPNSLINYIKVETYVRILIQYLAPTVYVSLEAARFSTSPAAFGESEPQLNSLPYGEGDLEIVKRETRYLKRISTIGDGNCAIHTILLSLSSSYRSNLVSRTLREQIAAYFRLFFVSLIMENQSENDIPEATDPAYGPARARRLSTEGRLENILETAYRRSLIDTPTIYLRDIHLQLILKKFNLCAITFAPSLAGAGAGAGMTVGVISESLLFEGYHRPSAILFIYNTLHGSYGHFEAMGIQYPTGNSTALQACSYADFVRKYSHILPYYYTMLERSAILSDLKLRCLATPWDTEKKEILANGFSRVIERNGRNITKQTNLPAIQRSFTENPELTAEEKVIALQIWEAAMQNPHELQLLLNRGIVSKNLTGPFFKQCEQACLRLFKDKLRIPPGDLKRGGMMPAMDAITGGLREILAESKAGEFGEPFRTILQQFIDNPVAAAATPGGAAAAPGGAAATPGGAAKGGGRKGKKTAARNSKSSRYTSMTRRRRA